MKKTAVVICPGRGTYNAPELGYLHRHHNDKQDLLAEFDAQRRSAGQTPLMELDRAERFSPHLHTRGDNASGLIFASAFCDAQSIHDSYDVLAVTGNSMGWYIALAVAGAAAPHAAFRVVNTMGTLMQQHLIGGQSLYPFVDENWQDIEGAQQMLLTRVAEIDAQDGCDLAVSIHLGGMLVVAGNAAGLAAFEDSMPLRDGRYPMRLRNHAAFHTPLQAQVAEAGRAALPHDLFATPQTPLIDGRGGLWLPGACTADALRDYTLGTQVTYSYDFTRAVQVAAKTFAPDVFILTGPGKTLGGAVAQSLIAIGWQGLTDKADFQRRQADTPILLSMGRSEDRPLVVAGQP
jgi:[acyl-carrier-protein] S-malonyltransferase